MNASKKICDNGNHIVPIKLQNSIKVTLDNIELQKCH